VSSALIRLQGVKLGFQTEAEYVVALADVTLGLDEGDLLAVVGASGSGKTSLINVIAGLLAADEGAVLIAGTDLTPMSQNQRADVRLNDIGVVFQDHNLIPEFDALENVSLPLRARGVPPHAALREAEERLDQVGLSKLGRRYPRQLSGGQQQRVGIARALTGGKRILLTDEPTGSLDATNSASIFALLRELADAGVCVVVASHDPHVLAVATRTVTMIDGRLSEPGVVAAK
jgi:ABC-type lipoprotein export system ATPase subunit